MTIQLDTRAHAHALSTMTPEAQSILMRAANLLIPGVDAFGTDRAYELLAEDADYVENQQARKAKRKERAKNKKDKKQ